MEDPQKRLTDFVTKTIEQYCSDEQELISFIKQCKYFAACDAIRQKMDNGHKYNSLKEFMTDLIDEYNKLVKGNNSDE